MKRNLYEEITTSVITALESGTIPWQRPWATSGMRGMPRSVSTGKVYNGINAFILGMSGYGSPWWMTFRQAKAQGGTVRRGEKGTQVVFWKFLEDKRKDAKKRRYNTRKVFKEKRSN